MKLSSFVAISVAFCALHGAVSWFATEAILDAGLWAVSAWIVAPAAVLVPLFFTVR